MNPAKDLPSRKPGKNSAEFFPHPRRFCAQNRLRRLPGKQVLRWVLLQENIFRNKGLALIEVIIYATLLSFLLFSLLNFFYEEAAAGFRLLNMIWLTN